MLVLFLVSLFALLIIGVPVAYGLVAAGSILMASEGLFSSDLVVQQFISGIDSFSLLAVPFFVMAGELMNKGGITKNIVNAVILAVGRFRGGLGYVSVGASMIFAGLSGSAVADTAALGGVLIPMMRKEGYSAERSTGIVISAAIIANIIPPSIGFILFGVVNGVSITQLFMGGIVPGILIGVLLMTAWFFTARKDGLRPSEINFTRREKVNIVIKSVPALILPIFIIVGLRGGIFTATEGGAIACAYALVIGAFVYRQLKWKDIPEILISTVKTTAKTMFIVGAALIVSWIITAGNLSAQIVSSFSGLVEHPILLVLVCQIVFLLFGMVLDIVPIIMVISPVIMPLIHAAGVDPVYFGILSIITMTFGLITPPVGTVLYVGSSISKISIIDAVKGALPFMLVEVGLILLLCVAPGIVTVPLQLLT